MSSRTPSLFTSLATGATLLVVQFTTGADAQTNGKKGGTPAPAAQTTGAPKGGAPNTGATKGGAATNTGTPKQSTPAAPAPTRRTRTPAAPAAPASAPAPEATATPAAKPAAAKKAARVGTVDTQEIPVSEDQAKEAQKKVDKEEKDEKDEKDRKKKEAQEAKKKPSGKGGAVVGAVGTVAEAAGITDKNTTEVVAVKIGGGLTSLYNGTLGKLPGLGGNNNEGAIRYIEEQVALYTDQGKDNIIVVFGPKQVADLIKAQIDAAKFTADTHVLFIDPANNKKFSKLLSQLQASDGAVIVAVGARQSVSMSTQNAVAGGVVRTMRNPAAAAGTVPDTTLVPQ